MIKIPISELEIVVLAANPATADTPIWFDDCITMWACAKCCPAQLFADQRNDKAGFERRPGFAFPTDAEVDEDPTLKDQRECMQCGRTARGDEDALIP